MTGLTEKLRSDFRLMKDLSVVLHKPVSEKMKEISNLITEMSKMKRVKELMEKWNFDIEKQPVTL